MPPCLPLSVATFKERRQNYSLEPESKTNPNLITFYIQIKMESSGDSKFAYITQDTISVTDLHRVH